MDSKCKGRGWIVLMFASCCVCITTYKQCVFYRQRNFYSYFCFYLHMFRPHRVIFRCWIFIGLVNRKAHIIFSSCFLQNIRPILCDFSLILYLHVGIRLVILIFLLLTCVSVVCIPLIYRGLYFIGRYSYELRLFSGILLPFLYATYIIFGAAGT
jgi:hypothetical protein